MKINRLNPAISLPVFIYAVYCALIPLDMVLNFTGSTVTKYVGIIAALLFLWRFIKKNNYYLTKDSLVFIYFFVWALLTVFWSVNFSRSLGAITTLMNLVALLVLVINYKFNEQEKRFIIYFMIFSSSLIIFYLAPNIEVSVTRATIQTAAGSADQNGLAANIGFALLMSLNELCYNKKIVYKLINVLCSLSMFISLLLIASRGALLATGGAAIIFFIRSINFSKIKLSKILKIIFGIGCLIILITFILKNIKLPGLERLEISAILMDRGSGRVDIWENVWTLTKDSFARIIFGYGYGTEGNVTSLVLHRFVGIHNVYLEILFTTGIIGLCLLIKMFAQPIKLALGRKDNLSLCLMIAMMINCFFLGFLSNKGCWNVMTLALIGLKPCLAYERTKLNDCVNIQSLSV